MDNIDLFIVAGVVDVEALVKVDKVDRTAIERCLIFCCRNIKLETSTVDGV
jgi:hypothetical protein